jgi:hypothetical protein
MRRPKSLYQEAVFDLLPRDASVMVYRDDDNKYYEVKALKFLSTKPIVIGRGDTISGSWKDAYHRMKSYREMHK